MKTIHELSAHRMSFCSPQKGIYIDADVYNRIINKYLTLPSCNREEAKVTLVISSPH